MKISPLKSALLTVGVLVFGAENLSAQEDKTTLSQDVKFEQLLAEKRKINTSITVNDRYKIQIYNGDSENAKKALIDFKKEFKSLDGTIVFSTPVYKVWVGNFRSRIEAERSLSDLRKKYPNALLIKPNK
ncbi:Sporulation related domain-containing protein [Flavobacterium longum]|uniref:SPOR domain-containing protein n=1 Tax=Flavobacterium longum TaxID=1299340 RepID=UPI0039E7DC26